MSPIFQLADDYVTESLRLHPINATVVGEVAYDRQLPDFSPIGVEARHRLDVDTLAALADLEVTGEDDRLCRDLLAERLGSEIALHEAGEWGRHLGEYLGETQAVRAVFDMMPRHGGDAWDNIAARLAEVGPCLAGGRATLDAALAQGIRGSRRQALAEATQSQRWSDDGWFASLADEAARAGVGTDLVDTLRHAGQGADAALAEHAAYLRDVYAPAADPLDGCGADRYRLHVRAHLGADLDPQEMYRWAWDEFARLRAAIAEVCAEILPGATFPEVVDLLESDPGRSLDTAEAYRRWLQEMTDDALARAAEHFDIAPVIDRCTVMLPPEGSSAAPYYTPPSEDFGREGRTWWPTLGRSRFPMWSDVTTCYHESVPGHHLQLGTALTQAEHLSRYQRHAFIPGHGEGWALYAEQLCDELGWFANPDHRLGFLAGQQLRAVRVIVDIGMHLGLSIPDGTVLSDGRPFHGGEVWSRDLAVEFSMVETGNTREYMESEIDRYLGWPAQAISYKIGQREWQRARDQVMARLGAAFDLRQFHSFALAKGAVGLDQLRAELDAFQPA